MSWLLFLIGMVSCLLVRIVILYWFIKKTLINLLYVSENMEDILFIINKFSEHLKSLYELPMFYGEPTIQSLIEHSKSVSDEIEKFVKNYSISEEKLEELEEDEKEE